MGSDWECIVVGGGAAGLSAALVLGRARRRTLVVDAGEPSNGVAHGIGGLLGQDGRPPHEFYAAGRAELAEYKSVQLIEGEVVAAAREDGAFRLELADGEVHRARRVLLATGMRYEYPDVPGLQNLWGGSAFHCPFCHGWEVRDQALAVLADGDRAVHMALLLKAWTDDIVVLTNGPTYLAAEQHQLLADAGVFVDERPVAEFVSHEGTLTAAVFTDGLQLQREGVLVASSLHQRSMLAAQLGVQIAPPGPAVVDGLLVDQMYRTSVPGVFAAGDTCAQMPQVSAAIASGSAAAAAVVQSLLSDRVRLPGPAWPVSTQEHWESRYAEKPSIWSGRVNAQLATVASDLTPGRALDLGCGEGADAVWLAKNGWQVVAVDVATTALQRAEKAAAAADVNDRIDFQHHDLSDSFPAGSFDLVSAQFLHSMVRLERPQILRQAAAAVNPGGTLLIVDHGEPPPWTKEHVHDHVFQSADEVLAELDLPGQWQYEHVGPVSREGVGPDGQHATLIDNLMVLKRA
jgi:thioredoxin reductase/SAM-dependent methyltransferase